MYSKIHRISGFKFPTTVVLHERQKVDLGALLIADVCKNMVTRDGL